MIIFLMLNFINCEKNGIIDPFWEINLEWDKENVKTKLSDYSKSGKIKNCVFSFEKEFYVHNQEFDARITSSLDNPIFERNEIKKLNYSLIVNFKNEQISQFNHDFFKYFKEKMEVYYGPVNSEEIKEDQIILYWKLPDNKTLSTTIIKAINHYLITFTNNE